MDDSTDVKGRAEDFQLAINDLKPGSVQLSKLTPEDARVVASLHHTYPQLRQDFRNIVDFADLMDHDSQNYEELFQSLLKITKAFKYRLADISQICRFAAAVGFAELAVKLHREVMKEIGDVYIAGISPPHPNHKVGCVAVLSSMLLDMTDKGMDIRLRLARTGVLQDMVQGLTTAKHLSGEVLDKGQICYRSIGTIHNCCKHPEVLPVVRQMNIAGHISPFLHKKCHHIRAAAMLLLGFIVEDSDLHLLKLDHEMLHYCLCRAEVAWDSGNRGKNGLETEEVLVGLSKLARLPSNRSLIVAKGAVQLLASVLQCGADDERDAAAATLVELSKDPENVKVFKRDKTVRGVLSGIEKSETNQELLHIVAELLDKITAQPDEECDDSPALLDLLADQLNVLTILGTGKVEFVLNQLRISITRGSHADSDVSSRVKVLRALRGLAADDSCRREILARGGLDNLQKLLQGGTESEKLEAVSLLQELTSCKEYCVLIQAHTGLMEAVKGLRQQGEQLSSTATHIVDTVTRHTQ